MVAREGNFTRAATKMGTSQSAISHTIRDLEAKLDIRLLTRTTRSVSRTAAGDRLYHAIGNRFDEIEAELDTLTGLRDKPGGTVRITCGDNVVKVTLLPKLLPLLLEYPDVNLELDLNYGFRDIVADRFDAGVRFGGTIDKDMIAIPIGPDVRMAAVASPSYFASHSVPKHPQDLTTHHCINIRFPTYGGLDVWEFERRGRRLNVRVNARVIFNTTNHMADAAVLGVGIAYLPEDEFAPHIEAGRLVRVLEEWCPSFSGYHLYYPTRRQPSPAFSLVVDALRLERHATAQKPAARRKQHGKEGSGDA